MCQSSIYLVKHINSLDRGISIVRGQPAFFAGRMGLCTSKDKEFDKYDKDQDGKMDKDELKKYVVEYNNGQLWQTVQLNLGLTEYEAQDCATLVAWQLSGGFNIATGQDNGGISMGAFTKFKTEYVEDPAGNQKFMLHTVFSSQDKDGNGYIDAEELDGLATKFFDGSWLKEGDPRMKNFKDKEHFKRLIHENCDEDKDGKFSFEEMVGVISGRANLVNDSAKNGEILIKFTHIQHAKLHDCFCRRTIASCREHKRRIRGQGCGQSTTSTSTTRAHSRFR